MISPGIMCSRTRPEWSGTLDIGRNDSDGLRFPRSKSLRPCHIEQIEISNYRCFRNVVLKDLPALAVVVGANGSGKSSLFDVLSFLKDSLAQNAAVAVERRGGYRELVSRGERGPIGITVKFRETGGRLVTYRLEIGANGGRIVVEREVLSYREGRRGRPRRFVDFRRGSGAFVIRG